eukprot:TRINITY_DN1508_c0_g1_i7.p1 TRINITY_DN1508_c0_g1~~TRINITY_DN1508_c0_g1_i7.p1  ORF type:complete len:238 (-),score=21.78 TRINITY_DN1508_c0_g1_i7:183-809(-)
MDKQKQQAKEEEEAKAKQERLKELQVENKIMKLEAEVSALRQQMKKMKKIEKERMAEEQKKEQIINCFYLFYFQHWLILKQHGHIINYHNNISKQHTITCTYCSQHLQTLNSFQPIKYHQQSFGVNNFLTYSNVKNMITFHEPRRPKLGIKPLQKAVTPSFTKVLQKQSKTPRYFPAVSPIIRDFTTSTGDPIQTAKNPAPNPEIKWV